MGNFLDEKMRKMANVPCVFGDDRCVAMRYMDNLILFTEYPRIIDNLKELFRRDLILKDLGKL